MTTTAPKPAPPLGLIFDEPEPVYRRSGAIGSTEVRAYLEDPEGYRLRYVDRHPMAAYRSSDASELGIDVHLLLQGEEHYRKAHVIAPADYVTQRGLSTSKEAKAWRASVEKPGVKVITPEDDAEIRFLVERIRANPVALRLMTGGRAEVTGRVKDPETGLLVQARWDVFHEEWSADYKTTASPIAKWRWHVKDYRLDVQAGLYDAVRVGVGAKRVPFFWIVQSTVWPFACRVIECPESIRDAAMIEVDGALAGIAAQKWGQPQSEPDVLVAL